MKKMILLLVIATVALACQKEELPDNPENPPVPESNYYPLTIGSYWVYQHYKVDTNGIAIEQNTTDSVIITKDTVINDKTYAVYEGTNKPINSGNWGIVKIVRDSSGYFVNQLGTIIFSSTNFTDTLNQGVEHKLTEDDTLFTHSSMMEDVDQLITYPAGTFEVLNYKTTYIFPYLIEIPPLYTRYKNNYYAPDVGQIVSSYFYASQTDVIERRLTSYYIAPE